MKLFQVFAFAVVFAAGCSVFPGLRVLTGENPTGQNIEVAALAELVMADKTGATDPSLMAAADRIEAANPLVDIIEIRKDETEDIFVVNMLFQLPPEANGQTQAALISLYTAIQRAMELTWQGTLRESEGTDAIRISFIVPQGIPTLDSGTSFIGFVTVNSEISRRDAITYLSGPRNLNNFLDLIVNGTLLYENPQGSELYMGSPNHPLFMLGTPASANTTTP